MLGTDPEFAIRSRSGRFIPAHKRFGPATRKFAIAPGVLAFRDGFMVELNIRPQRTATDLVKFVRMGVRAVNRLLPSAWELCTNAAITIDLKDMKDAPEDVRHFGCNPSYCAYSRETKIVRADPMTTKLRSAGAHMHFSVTPEEIETTHSWYRDPENHVLFIKMLDYYVGLPLARIFHAPSQYQRRELYGQAGEFRPQDYPDGSSGLEYRTPPPQLWNSAEIAIKAFSVGEEVFNNFTTLQRLWTPSIEEPVRTAINTGRGLSDVPLGNLGFNEPLIEKYFADPSYRLFQLPDQNF